MSTTLTWASSGAGTKTGTTVATFITDLATLIDAVSGGASFSWQRASSSTAGNPHYLVLKPKAGGAGRILIVLWTSAPAGNNAAILDVAPTANAAYIAAFPAGNVDTPSNLTASSGTILGDDTGAVKCAAWGAIATIYTTSIVHYYFDSADACFFGTNNPAVAQNYPCSAGQILVDAGDTAYWGTMGTGANANPFGSSTSPIAFSAPTISAGTNTAGIRTNYGSTNRCYFCKSEPTGWGAQAVGPNDIMTDTANGEAYFDPIPLIAQQVKGEGAVLKFRQFGLGPQPVGAFQVYNSTGPVVAARCVCATTAGGSTGHPWLTNFKI